MVQIILLLLSLTASAHADPQDEALHFAAHAGTSFALQETLYGVNEKELGMTRREAQLTAFAETMLLGLAYKASQSFPTDTGKSMLYNAIGAGLSIGVSYTFEF